jgi:O-antigen/teichoic acid export membrane protein
MMMGMGVSLPKFLSVETDRKQLEIHYSAITIVSALFLISVMLGFLFSEQFSQMVFGDVEHEKMCIIILLYVYSLMIHACIYNYFRGKFKFKISSFLQLINVGVLPLIVYFFVDDIYHYFLCLSILTLFLLLVVNALSIPFLILSLEEFKSGFKKLMNYGVQRMPGDVMLGLFFALPTFIAANYFSLIVAGNIAFCISLFNIIIALMSPVNIILLPEASKIVSQKNFTLLKNISAKLLLLSLALGIFSFLVVFSFGDFILEIFSVKDITNTAPMLMIVFFGVIGYSVFSVIRSVVDAYYETAKVSFNIIISFFSFILFLLILQLLDMFSIFNTLRAFSLSVNILGILTYLSLRQIYKIQKI